jgi:hypothetical protein
MSIAHSYKLTHNAPNFFRNGFNITTDDLESGPLSSMKFLQMRWNLSRIADLQGSADYEDEDEEESGGDTDFDY